MGAPASDLGFHLPLPPLTFPGAIIGNRAWRNLEMSSYRVRPELFLLIATPTKVYASRGGHPRFVRLPNCHRMGAHPAASVLGRTNGVCPQGVGCSARRAASHRRAAADDRTVVLVALAIPGRSSVSLGFDASGAPLEAVPAQLLLLLPVLGIFAFVADLTLGLFFYRRDADRPVAFMLWIASAFTPTLLILATLIIL